MSWFLYLIWTFCFLLSVVVVYSLPITKLPLLEKFMFIGLWGTGLGAVFFTILSKKNKELLESKESLETELMAVLPKSQSENPETIPLEESPLASVEANVETNVFPFSEWESFCLLLQKNRPFSEVIENFSEILPQIFPNSSGILYMYNGKQTELEAIFQYGIHKIGEEQISSIECVSIETGKIVVTDFFSGLENYGCTHLKHRPKGYAFCVPIEGAGEHFGVLTIQIDEIANEKDLNDWKTKLNVVTSTFGLYVAEQDCEMKLVKNSIRDVLTGLYNRRYMEESLQRELHAANRHRTPIGMIMIYPDHLEEILEKLNQNALDQLLWEIGQRLPGYIRAEDIPCRFNESVFAIILPGADQFITRDRAEKIRREIEALKIEYGKFTLASTLSVGVANLPQNAHTAQGLMDEAYRALEQAAQEGGNRLVIAEIDYN